MAGLLNIRTYSVLFALLCWPVLVNPVVAETPADNQAIVQTVHSNLLNEDRTVQVFLPAGYKPDSSTRYDVVYVIDGEMLGRFFPPVRSFDEENDLIPPVIIVGINNLYWYDKGTDSRDRDLLPAHVAGSPLSGGADTFIAFLKTELIPYIDKTYATSGHATLFGHSYGGMFTFYTFLTHPEMFDSYIASDPALWWNNGYVDKLAAAKLDQLPKDRKTLFIGGRSGRINEAFGIRQMTTLLRTRAPDSLRWKSVANDDEDHGSVRLKDIYDGLKFTYFGHVQDMIDVFPRDGILLKGKPVAIMNYATFLGEEPGIRYTLDGSEPTVRSAKYDYGIEVSAPAILTVKQFSNWGADKTVTGRFTPGKAFAAVALPKAATGGGLSYATYAGTWDGLPDMTALTPTATGRTDGGFSVGKLGGQTSFAARFDGYIQAGEAGYYIFFLDADAAARLSIDGQVLMTIDKPGGRSFVVPLQAGHHVLRLDYVHKSGDAWLNLTYLPPVAAGDPLAHLPIAIPAELQFAEAGQ